MKKNIKVEDLEMIIDELNELIDFWSDYPAYEKVDGVEMAAGYAIILLDKLISEQQ